MKKAGVIGIIVVLIVIIVLFGFGLFSNFSTNTNSELSQETNSGSQAIISSGEENTETESGSNQETNVETATEWIVEITSSGSFNPETLIINSGDKVTWTNKGTRNIWPASNNHPTHTIYSGFDSLQGLGFEESYSFTFDKVGTWKYHDHLRSSIRGTIIVN